MTNERNEILTAEEEAIESVTQTLSRGGSCNEELFDRLNTAKSFVKKSMRIGLLSETDAQDELFPSYNTPSIPLQTFKTRQQLETGFRNFSVIDRPLKMSHTQDDLSKPWNRKRASRGYSYKRERDLPGSTESKDRIISCAQHFASTYEGSEDCKPLGPTPAFRITISGSC